MVVRAYVCLARDEIDGRRKRVTLSPLALTQLPGFERVWQAGEESVRHLLVDHDAFLPNSKAIEDRLIDQSFTQRVSERLSVRPSERK